MILISNAYIAYSFGNLGRLQVNQVQHIARNYSLLGSALTPDIRHKIAEVFLAASYFLDSSWKIEALEAFNTITRGEEPPIYLQTWANLRKCTVASIESHDKLKDSVIQPKCCDQPDARTNAFYGQWLLSYSANQIKCENLALARSTLSVFSPLNGNYLSTMERLVFMKMKIIQGKIYRYSGDFPQARNFLVPQQGENPVLDQVTAWTRISHLAAVHCELGQPDIAVGILRDELRTMEALGIQNQRKGRCLQLALAEALLQQRQLEEAQCIYLKVMDIFHQISDADMITKISKLRVCIGFARVSHIRKDWSGALGYWNKALKAATECGWREGFVQMIIHYSIYHAERHHQLHAAFHLQRADELLKKVGRQFWWTDLGTSWLDYIWEGVGRDIRDLPRR